MTAGTERENPLEHADIGTTHTVQESRTFHSINITPDEFWGTDRFPDHIHVTDIEVVETEDMSCGPDITITWEADVTKRPPHRWDYHADPVTQREKTTARRKKWIRRLIPPGITLATIAVAFAASLHVMNRMAGEMTVNGEPVTAPGLAEFLPVVLLVAGLSYLIAWGLSGGFPGGMRL